MQAVRRKCFSEEFVPRKRQRNDIQVFKLDAETELRFEVEGKAKVTLELKSGTAEIFGTELVTYKKYLFTGDAKMAVATWHGCTLELNGDVESAYIGKETPMVVYVNIHASLEEMRQKAEEKDTKGPKVLIVGPTDVGKSTLCRLLLNYAVRLGGRPIFVDLDVAQGEISIPGTIGAMLIERPADIERGFSQQAPLIFHYGHERPENNIVLYNTIISRLAELVKLRGEKNKKVGVSGTIINTCGWTGGESYKAIQHAALAFEVDLILVIDHDKLYNDLVRDMPSSVKTVLVEKSGGVVVKCQKMRADARNCRVKEYFYGHLAGIYPHSFKVKFREVKIYKIGAPSLPESCMPLGMKAEVNHTKIMPVPCSPKLLYCVLSVSRAKSTEENIIRTNIAGFICITSIDMEHQTLTVLSPCSQLLPKNILLLSDVQFMD